MANINIVMRYFEISESSPQEEERLKRAREQGFNVDDPHYHGTPGGDFDEFDPYRTADEDLAYGAGIYMSRDPDAASGYSRPGTSWGNHIDDARPTVYKVYHRVKNPFDMSKFYPYAEVKRIMEHCFTEDELESIPFWQEIQEEVQYSSRTSEEWEELSEYLINLESGGRFDDMPDPDRYEDGEDDPEYIEDEEEARKYEIKSIQKRIQNIEERTAREYEDHKKMVATGRKGSALGKEIYRTLWTNTSEYHDWKAESQLFGGETETFEFKTEANRWLEELGYDGLTHVDRYNPGNKGVSHNVTIAFHPQQVRSAHANFDPDKTDSPKLSEGKKQISPADRFLKTAASFSNRNINISFAKDDFDSVALQKIKVYGERGMGVGSEVMKNVIKLADKCGVTLELEAYPIDDDISYPTALDDNRKKTHPEFFAAQQRLIRFYERFGFKIYNDRNDNAFMVRTPKLSVRESYQEGPDDAFVDGGNEYRINDIFKATEKALVFDIPISKLKWQMEKENDEDRINSADCSVPILVWKKGNRLICVDGMHRLQKAVRFGLKTLPAKYVLDTIMKKARISEAIFTEKVWLDDRGFAFGVNPTRREFMGKFERDGAAGVLMKNGSLAVGNAESLTHADLAATCGFESKDIKYHLQIWDVLENGTISIEVELWNESENQQGASKKFSKPSIEAIRRELEKNPNISRLKMPVVITVRNPDWEIIVRESRKPDLQKQIAPPTAGEILTLIKNHYRNNDVWTRGDCGTFATLISKLTNGEAKVYVIGSEGMLLHAIVELDGEIFDGRQRYNSLEAAAAKYNNAFCLPARFKSYPGYPRTKIWFNDKYPKDGIISELRPSDEVYFNNLLMKLRDQRKRNKTTTFKSEKLPKDGNYRYTKGLNELARPKTRVQADEILRNAGYSRLGNGAFGAVYRKPGKPYVLKVFTAKDQAYRDFVALAMAHKNNPHFPRFIGNIVHVTPDICAIRMEPLTPYKHNHSLITMYLRWRDYKSNDPNNFISIELENAKEILTPKLKKACDLIIDNLMTRYACDLKQENLMMRGSTIVFTDPVSSNPEDSGVVLSSQPHDSTYNSADDALLDKLYDLKESYHPEMISNENIPWTKSAKKNAELAASLLRKAGFDAVTENPSGRKTDSRFAAIGSKTNGILVNPRCGYWKDPVAAAQLNFKVGHLSTDHPLGVLLHEIAHIIYDAPDNWFADLHKEVAKRVSKYAASNPKEFVSEVYAGINTGKKYDDEVMKFYNMYARK